MGILDRLFSSPAPFISDGGMETDLIFHEGAEMPLFASFVLLDSPEGCEMLRRYAVSYFDLAQVASRGFVMGTPTWRANGGWGRSSGWTTQESGTSTGAPSPSPATCGAPILGVTIS